MLGSGPIRIGQGIEFDYSSVHAVRGAASGGHQGDRHQQQPGDGQHRLPPERPPLLRAADPGRSAERGRARARGPAGRDRAVRRADGAQPGPAADRGRRDDPGHLARLDRRHRGPQADGGGMRATGHSHARLGHRPQPGRAGGVRAADRLPGAGAPLLRARRARDADRPRTRRSCATTCRASAPTCASTPS